MKKTLLALMILFSPHLASATSPEDYFNAGTDLLKQHDYAKAVDYFRAAVDQRPDYWQAYQFLGEAYYQSANRTEAVVAMKESLRLHPNNPGLEKFMERVKKDSPWQSAGFFQSYLPAISILVSLLTLAWTWVGPRRMGSRRNHSDEAKRE